MSRIITDVVALDDDDALSGGLVAGVELTIRDDGRREVWHVGVDPATGETVAQPEPMRRERRYAAETQAHGLALAIEDVFVYGLCRECGGAGRYEQPRVPGGRDPADVVEVQCEACDGTGRAS